MSIGFDWFKEYKIEDHSDCWHTDFELHYIEGGSTSHSAGNVIIVQNLLEKYGGKRIPSVNRDWIDSVDYDLGLIEPNEMSNMCSKALATSEVDEADMRDRVEWFKKLSDEGYYLAYSSW